MEDLIKFAQDCFPNIAHATISSYVAQHYSTQSNEFIMNYFFSLPAPMPAAPASPSSSFQQTLSEEPPIAVFEISSDDDEPNNSVEVQQQQQKKEAAPSSNVKPTIDNTTLKQLHLSSKAQASSARKSPQHRARQQAKSKNSGVNLASIHEQRLKSLQESNNTMLTTNNSTVSSGITKPATLKQQIQAARERHKQRWKAVTPAARSMTIADLQQKEKSTLAANAGDWGQSSSTSSASSNIRTISNSIANPETIGREALRLTNLFRAKNKLPVLQWSSALTKIAEGHSRDMGDKKVPFSHNGFDKRSDMVPFPKRTFAENLAFNNYGAANVAQVSVDGWIKSPGHCKNLLSNTNYCGIGVYCNARGEYYLTQLFALV